VSERPAKFADLCAFYNNEYRPLYDRFICLGAVAQELHTEIAAGADHLFSNAGADGDIPPEEIERAVAHFKRATFDAFKMVFEAEIRGQYALLMDRKYADVHDGKFRGEITALWNEAKSVAANARGHETLSRRTDIARWGAAFAEWKKILPLADEFSRIMSSPEVVRATKKSRNEFVRDIVIWFVGLFAGALLGKFL